MPPPSGQCACRKGLRLVDQQRHPLNCCTHGEVGYFRRLRSRGACRSTAGTRKATLGCHRPRRIALAARGRRFGLAACARSQRLPTSHRATVKGAGGSPGRSGRGSRCLDRALARPSRVRLAGAGGRRGSRRGRLLRAGRSRAPADRSAGRVLRARSRFAIRATGPLIACAALPRTRSSSLETGRPLLPAMGEGIRTAFYFGIACGRELTAVLEGRRPRGEALERYASFSAGHARSFAIAGRLQQIIPALPPRLLMSMLRVIGRQWLIDRSFGWYLDQAHPSFAAPQGRLRASASEQPVSSHSR